MPVDGETSRALEMGPSRTRPAPPGRWLRCRVLNNLGRPRLAPVSEVIDPHATFSADDLGCCPTPARRNSAMQASATDARGAARSHRAAGAPKAARPPATLASPPPKVATNWGGWRMRSRFGRREPQQ